MSKRKKSSSTAPEPSSSGEESVTTRATVPKAVMDQARGVDPETTVDRVEEFPPLGGDDLDAPTVNIGAEDLGDLDSVRAERKHLRGLVEALVFASDAPIKPTELAKLAQSNVLHVKEQLDELRIEYAERGIQLEEVAGGWVFRTNVHYAPFVRDLTKQKPIKLTRAQVETLAIIAYRQPITRPEMDDVRGVDSGPVLKLLLERDLIRILGKRDEPGRPLIYGTTNHFLEFFGLRSLKDLPTLREFTELSEESKDVFEAELGEAPTEAAFGGAMADARENRGNETADDGERSVDEHVGEPTEKSIADDDVDMTLTAEPPLLSSPDAQDD